MYVPFVRMRYCSFLPVWKIISKFESYNYKSIDWTKLWFKLLILPKSTCACNDRATISECNLRVELGLYCVVQYWNSQKTLELWRPSVSSIDPMLYFTQGHSSYLRLHDASDWHIDSLKTLIEYFSCNYKYWSLTWNLTTTTILSHSTPECCFNFPSHNIITSFR